MHGTGIKIKYMLSIFGLRHSGLPLGTQNIWGSSAQTSNGISIITHQQMHQYYLVFKIGFNK
jgi:hypothetical protein